MPHVGVILQQIVVTFLCFRKFIYDSSTNNSRKHCFTTVEMSININNRQYNFQINRCFSYVLFTALIEIALDREREKPIEIICVICVLGENYYNCSL